MAVGALSEKSLEILRRLEGCIPLDVAYSNSMKSCKSLETQALEEVISYCCRPAGLSPKLDWQQLPKIFHEVIWKGVHKRRFRHVLKDLDCIFEYASGGYDPDERENDFIELYDIWWWKKYLEKVGDVGASPLQDHQRRFSWVLADHRLQSSGRDENPYVILMRMRRLQIY